MTLGADRIYYTCCQVPEGDQPGQVCSVVPVEDPELIDRLREAGVTFEAQPQASGALTTILGWVLPLLPLLAI